MDIKKPSTAVIEAAKRRNYWTAFHLMEVAKLDGKFIHLTNFKDREWRGTLYYTLPNVGETEIQAKFTQKGDQIKGDINDFLIESQKPGLWSSEVQGTIAQDLHVQFSTPKRNQITGEVEQTIYEGNFYSGVLSGTFKASNGASGEFVFYQLYNGAAPLSQ